MANLMSDVSDEGEIDILGSASEDKGLSLGQVTLEAKLV